jgi:hypothetical protein
VSAMIYEDTMPSLSLFSSVQRIWDSNAGSLCIGKNEDMHSEMDSFCTRK